MVNVAKTPCNIDHALNYYSDLCDNWDGEGGLAPTQEALRNATKFLDLVNNLKNIDLPSVFLSSDGEINFVWRDKISPIYIDIGFKGPGYSYFAVDHEKREIMEDRENFDQDDLECLLKILPIK